MNARIPEEQVGLFPHAATTRMTRETELEAIRFAAMRARDEAIAAGVRKLFSAIGRGLVFAAEAMRAWPERRRTYENLRALTDRELADIGLTRSDIFRVFEPDFSANQPRPANGLAPRPANGNLAVSGKALAA
ncbi:DUF1127 domain-containing protein [Falsiroseomonas sp.]|jgi:uncharacterized protein YjiS (DUF1127 family)|uniref:DUF1127 domain-containing protein n=1 Tax=Falsiroseomonas sp. TaxID=2870721 RepID=UPI003F703485